MFQFSSLAGITHGISTRDGGVSPAPYNSLNLSTSTGDDPENVRRNRALFLRALNVPSASVTAARLYHRNEVTVFRGGRPWPETYDERAGAVHGDAAVSEIPGQYFTMTFADCVPLLFADKRRGVVGAAHAGWRGTALGIAALTVRAMQDAFGSVARDIVVGVGPSIGPCCFRVGDEVPRAFEAQGWPAVLAADAGHPTIDLWATNRRQLVESGVRHENIEEAGICTSCSIDRFYSHRAEDGRTGRFALCIGLS